MSLERLQAELAALEDESARRQALTRRIAAIDFAKVTIARLDPKIRELTTLRDQFVAWRKELSDRLLACPSQQRNRRDMDHEDQLRLSISNIDRGCEVFGSMVNLGVPLGELMRAAGYVPEPGQTSVWSAVYGSLPATLERLGTLQRQRAEAQAVLDQNAE
jgi:hypothetical protein